MWGRDMLIAPVYEKGATSREVYLPAGTWYDWWDNSVQKGGAKVVLAGMTLPPNYGAEYIRRFEAMYKELAREYRLTLIPFLLEGVAGQTALMQRDGLHPTAEGARMVAGTVLKYVEPELKRTTG